MVFITVGLLLQKTEDACYCTEGERKRQGVKLNGNLCRSAFGARSGQVSRSMQTPIFSLWSLWTVQQRFQTAHAPSSCPSCRSVCVQRQQRQESRKRKVPAQGRAVPRRGTARKDFAEESCCPLKTLCHSNPSVCLVMLGISSIQMFPSQTCVHPGCGSCSEHLFSSETL